MSTISIEGRRDDTVRKIKEDFHQKEAEDTKRHKTELKNLNEQHQIQLEKLKEEHAAQLKQLQGYLRSRLSEKEQEHQGQIQEVRDLYTQQLKKRYDDGQVMRSSLKQNYEAQLENQERNYSTKQDQLTTEFNRELQKRDDALQEFTDNARELNTKVWNERKGKLDQAHNDELSRAQAEHNQKLSATSRDFREYRKNKEFEVNRLVNSHQAEKQKVQERHLINHKAQAEINAANHEQLTEEFKTKQALIKKDARENFEKKYEVIVENNNIYRQNSEKRINDQIGTANAQLKGERDETSRALSSVRRQFEVEKKNIANAYQDQLGKEQAKNDQIRSLFGSQIDRDVSMAIKSRDDQMKQIIERQLKTKGEQAAVNTAQLGQVKREAQALVEQTKARAESEVFRTNQWARQNAEKSQSFYKENIDLLKKEFSKELNEERIRHIEERTELETRFETKIRERERELAAELDQRKVMFQDQLQQQKERFQTEINHREGEYRERMAAQDSRHRDELKSMELKYQSQIQQIKDNQTSEIEALDKRHRQELNQFAIKMTQKKSRV